MALSEAKEETPLDKQGTLLGAKEVKDKFNSMMSWQILRKKLPLRQQEMWSLMLIMKISLLVTLPIRTTKNQKKKEQCLKT